MVTITGSDHKLLQHFYCRIDRIPCYPPPPPVAAITDQITTLALANGYNCTLCALAAVPKIQSNNTVAPMVGYGMTDT